MNMERYNKKLEIEQEKLKMLANEAMKRGIPLNQDEAFMTQNRKVDALIVKIQKEKVKQQKSEKER